MAALAAERAGRINATSNYRSPVNYEGLHGGYVSILTEYMDNNPSQIASELGLLSPHWQLAPLSLKALITEFPQPFQSAGEQVIVDEEPGESIEFCDVNPVD